MFLFSKWSRIFICPLVTEENLHSQYGLNRRKNTSLVRCASFTTQKRRLWRTKSRRGTIRKLMKTLPNKMRH
ncbi:hypothetical protein KIN20_036287 [Parelaphostrongylus tenuis]|uniref:Uncharacterized protein n=1 Tax=Parelaphostrongylus tenuis TaxID=148309 RepID=A0AAD5RCB2_PARTN|nr:hypothetical protein KIN20_036287 [Parelaphostrongylus tenuis]